MEQIIDMVITVPLIDHEFSKIFSFKQPYELVVTQLISMIDDSIIMLVKAVNYKSTKSITIDHIAALATIEQIITTIVLDFENQLIVNTNPNNY